MNIIVINKHNPQFDMDSIHIFGTLAKHFSLLQAKKISS